MNKEERLREQKRQASMRYRQRMSDEKKKEEVRKATLRSFKSLLKNEKFTKEEFDEIFKLMKEKIDKKSF